MEALRLLLTSTPRIKVISMPTGGGKSAVIMAYAILSKRPTVIVTESIGLMEQYLGDFRSLGLVSLMGRARYDCDLGLDYTCEDGVAAHCPHKGSMMCPLSQSQLRAQLSPFVITNYAKWTQAKRFGMGLEHQTQVIFDEGHTAPDAVAKAMQVILHAKEIEDKLGLDFPHADSEMVTWKEWAIKARLEAEQEMLAARANLGLHARQSVVRHYLHMRNLTRRLTTIATAQARNWIADEHKGHKGQADGFQFDPLRAGAYAEATLFLKMPNVAIFSATIRPKTLYQLHQPRGSFGFWEFPSDFNPNDSPIYHVPTMRVDRHHPDLSPLWLRFDQAAGRRRDRNGICHTISYARREDILNWSSYANSMLINARGEAATGIVEDFKEADPGTILVSPSVGSGYDFPGIECEWQFICKIPFPDSRSKIMRARQEDDKEYGAYAAANKLEQIVGRGARFKGDRCENILPDDNFRDWFYPRYKHLFTDHFKRRYKELQFLPTPPPSLRAA